ncbi:MAG: ABC transporter ATP-binding protein [Candidatus Solibacter usitatus]|nr:ABC transporter ATP-binding protein [Candidatus Solibacter usitatus]
MQIQASNLTRQFGSLTAVDCVNFSVAKGEVFGLVGPDGAGKTTTLRMLCGLMNPTAGEMSVAGYDVARNPDAVKDRIGYMAQKFGLYGDLTVNENMRFYSDLFGIVGKERDELTARLLQMTRMQPFLHRPAAKLSGGMKQKLALMCTLLHKPEILFLDEPTNGVDPVSRRDFWAILQQLVKDGLTVMVTTAYLDEAERCDRVALMNYGRLILMDTPLALREQLPESCYEVRGDNLRPTRDYLRTLPEVSNVELAGNTLHVFVKPGVSEEQVMKATAGHSLRRVLPSLEDVFIATVRKGVSRDAA